MAKASVKKDIVRVTLDLTYEEAKELFEILDEREEKDVQTSTEIYIYEALRDVLV